MHVRRRACRESLGSTVSVSRYGSSSYLHRLADKLVIERFDLVGGMGHHLMLPRWIGTYKVEFGSQYCCSRYSSELGTRKMLYRDFQYAINTSKSK